MLKNNNNKDNSGKIIRTIINPFRYGDLNE